MSRLIVKGLPKYYTEEKLRGFFGKQGDVTDVKLMKTRNGESRRFAFIGYKSQEDAERAVKYFHNSFIDTARIDVQLAKTFSDPTVPVSYKEHRRQQEAKLREQEDRLLEEEARRLQKKHKKGPKSALDEEIAKNPKLQEYMEVMKHSHQVKSWANDAAVDGSGAPSARDLEDYLAQQERATAPVAAAPARESDDEYEDFEARPSDEQEEQPDEPMMSLADVGVKPVGDDATDLDWLKARRRRMKDGEVTAADGSQDTSKPPVRQRAPAAVPTGADVPELSVEDKIAATGRLFIRNILYTSTEQDFRALFSEYGTLEEVHVAVDTRTGKSKGFVYVQFANPQNAVAAFRALDKQIFQGRLLHILPGEQKKDHRLDEFDLKNLPLKKQKELKKKAQASKAQFTWNSLYMNTDAVLSSVAARMGIAKSQLIDAQSSDSAVKQALAEASVIGDVRKYFEQQGVDLASFAKHERDDRVILVKNFPYGTTLEEIGELFQEHGQLKRMLMPPAGTIAIVEFRDAPSARAAFTKIAYKRFKKSIIYLEKGPRDLFTREPAPVETEAPKPEKAVEAKVSAAEVLADDSDDSGDVDGPTVSVFVKNLNFATTAEALTELFKPLTGFVVATVKTKADPKRAGSYLSMGFGFVEFRTKEQAQVAIKSLDGHVLDGHRLQLKLSHRQSGTAAMPADKTKSTKIIVKNLPFEATRKDMVELFGAYGNLKSVRVPKKFDRSVRGFAFVEFALLKEAENAMRSLEGVHLLGRRLVMQYAERDAENAEEQIDKMTRKVKKQVATTQLNAARLAGKGKHALLEEETEFDHI
ncbi:RRM domain-containing protein [[Candida] zeylanoides]